MLTKSFSFAKIALKYHPDQAGNSPEAVETFRRVQDAYGVLSKVDLRKSYDIARKIITTDKAVIGGSASASAISGDNYLKNVAISRPASAWTGTREKYRHESWQKLSLNIKKVGHASQL